LLQRLVPWYDESPATAQVMPRSAHFPGGFGTHMAEVNSITVHMTAGWLRRERQTLFVNRYVHGEAPRGEGTQFLISGDGTVHRLIDLPLETWHATWVNGWSIGVETSNRGDAEPPPNINWLQVSTRPEDDIPGAKLWVTSARPAHDEVTPAWWTTAGYSGPGVGNVGAGRMLFTEWQYRSWALLLRHLAEELGLPRNFSLLPHRRRGQMTRARADFRKIVLADARAEMMMDEFAGAPINIAATSFDPANDATLRTQYESNVLAQTAARREGNRAWYRYLELYRGVHGHAYGGAKSRRPDDKTACPGPVFDYHRLAREVWDYWWYPFDVDGATTAAPRRGYRDWDEDTELLEYYFDESESARTARLAPGIHGNRASPTTFVLDPRSPIYALANGWLVAARFPPETAGVSLAFALVRHEVFHARRWPGFWMGQPLPGTIDYRRPPATVYSLYMHLGRPPGMSFDQVSDDNPDWLNRVLIRKRECDLGLDFRSTDHGIPEARWNNRRHGLGTRPTTLEGWQADQPVLDRFLGNLGRGEIAVAMAEPNTQPIRVLLGDFLGESGIIRRLPIGSPRGVRVETFSPSFVPPTFSRVDNVTGWAPPAGRPRPCLHYISEWARVPTAAETQAMTNLGVDTSLLAWWQAVWFSQRLDRSLPADARLPFAGSVFHYQPLDFMRWINDVTWKSEWPKFGVVVAGTAVPAPARPRTRRV
jgi:hypothetical protein